MKAISFGLVGLFGTATLAACTPDIQQAEDTEAATQEAASPLPATADEDIRHFLLQKYPDAEQISYALAWQDLDGDGADEAIVSLGGPYFCGSGGCNLLVLTPAGPMWRKVGDVSVTRTPVTVLDTATNGWKDLTVEVSGGGGPAGTALLRFDGESYPSNASVPPAELTDTSGAEILPATPEYVTVEAEPQP